MSLDVIMLTVSLGCKPCSAAAQVTCLRDHLNKSVCEGLELLEVWYCQKG